MTANDYCMFFKSLTMAAHCFPLLICINQKQSPTFQSSNSLLSIPHDRHSFSSVNEHPLIPALIQQSTVRV